MPNFFAVCVPGLESFTTKELKDLGLPVSSSTSSRGSLEGKGEVEEVGGVEFRGLWPTFTVPTCIFVPRAEFCSILVLSMRILFPTWTEGQTASLGSLPKPAVRWLWRVTCHRSRLFHSGGVIERILESSARVWAKSSNQEIGWRRGKQSPTIDHRSSGGEPLHHQPGFLRGLAS